MADIINDLLSTMGLGTKKRKRHSRASKVKAAVRTLRKAGMFKRRSSRHRYAR